MGRVVTPWVCWSLTSLCHSNGHIETMPAREMNLFTALTRIRSQFLRIQWRAIISEWTRLRLRPLSHRGWPSLPGRGRNPYPRAPPTMGLLVVWRPQSNDSRFSCGLFIMDHLTVSNSHLLRHQGEGSLLLSRSSIGTLLLDLCPKAMYTFAPFSSS